MYLVTYCQIKPWVRARLRPLVNSRLINLSHQIQWTLQTCLNLCWSYIQNRNALLDRELSRGMVLFCHILKTLCTSHPLLPRPTVWSKPQSFHFAFCFFLHHILTIERKKFKNHAADCHKNFQVYWNKIHSSTEITNRYQIVCVDSRVSAPYSVRSDGGFSSALV